MEELRDKQGSRKPAFNFKISEAGKMQTFSFMWSSSLESNLAQAPMQLLFKCSYSRTSFQPLLNPTVIISFGPEKMVKMDFKESYITIYVFDRKKASSSIA